MEKWTTNKYSEIMVSWCREGNTLDMVIFCRYENLKIMRGYAPVIFEQPTLYNHLQWRVNKWRRYEMVPIFS